MTQAQFFLFGLLLVWFTGTGKLRALVNALASEPNVKRAATTTTPGPNPFPGGDPGRDTPNPLD